MTQVETVALWAGLISSIAGIVLSIVAIVFAIWVNDRASEINNQMIRSLQKIESSVDRVSSDTRELITAGWNKMLGGLGQESEDDEPEKSVEEISSGMAAEVRSKIEEGSHGKATDPATTEQLQEAVDELRETLAAQLRERERLTKRGPTALDDLVARMSRLPIEGRALLQILAHGRHIDKQTYRAAMNDPNLREALRTLRRAGLLVPLVGYDESGESSPVYYLPPGMSRRIRVASGIIGDVPPEIVSRLRNALEKYGYAKE